MVLPLLAIIGIMAAGGAIGAGGAALSNLTRKPSTIIYDAPGTDYYDTGSPATGGINLIWLVAGAAALFLIMRK